MRQYGRHGKNQLTVEERAWANWGNQATPPPSTVPGFQWSWHRLYKIWYDISSYKALTMLHFPGRHAQPGPTPPQFGTLHLSVKRKQSTPSKQTSVCAPPPRPGPFVRGASKCLWHLWPGGSTDVQSTPTSRKLCAVPEIFLATSDLCLHDNNL